MEMDSEGWYTGGNFTTCGSLILQLSEKAWFMENVKQWLWYDTEDESIEDLKEHYGKKSEDILFPMKIPSVVPIRDEMTEAQFEQMMATGLKQAKQGDSLDIDEGW